MIATWMLAATLLGLFVALAATSLERALRLLGRQTRFAWLLALAITIVWPLLAPALLRPEASRAVVQVIAAGSNEGAVEASATPSRSVLLASALREALTRLDLPLALLWGAATLLLLLRAALSVRALRRLAHRAERRMIDGQPVLVSSAVGPAAFGIVEPRIVLPSWSLDLDPSMRAMVLRHEQEHVAARDPAMLTLAWIGAALMPWNPALWIIARRLRAATELDCDHRVLRHGTDAQRYARLLLLMVQRQTPAAFAALMAGSPTTLHERIDAMHAQAPARPRLRAALLFALAVIASTVAASPAIAGQLAAVRGRFAQSVQQTSTASKPPSNSRNTVRELPLVVVSPDRSVEVPLIQKREPQQPRKPSPDTVPVRPSVVVPSVDSTLKPVAFAPGGSPTPRYPEILQSAGVAGEVLLQIVVDSSGLPMQNTLKIVRKSHDLFELSVRDVLPRIRFFAASVGDRKVRQLVQLLYRFDLEDAPPKAMPPMSASVATFVIDVTAKPR